MIPTRLSQPITTKALVITYNPTMDPSTGKKLTDLEGWSSPDAMVNGYISSLLQVSNGLARHQVVQNIVLDEFPALTDGFQYTAQSFLPVLNGSTPAHNPSGIDYNAILTRFNILQSVANNQFDEVWIMGFPYAGLYESIMAGAGAFWCNAPALANTASCNRRFVIMGFNYQRAVGEMLHSYAHRAESIMAQLFNCQSFLAWAYQANRSPATVTAGQTLNLFQRFMLYNQIAPGQAGVRTRSLRAQQHQGLRLGQSDASQQHMLRLAGFSKSHRQYSQCELLRMGQRRRWRIPTMVAESSAEGERNQKRNIQQLVVLHRQSKQRECKCIRSTPSLKKGRRFCSLRIKVMVKSSAWRDGRAAEGACLENMLGSHLRGFESHSLRHQQVMEQFISFWGGARAAEWARLLSECRGNSVAGSNPALPAVTRFRP